MDESTVDCAYLIKKLNLSTITDDLMGHRLSYSDEEIINFYQPLSEKLIRLSELKKRVICAIAGPPGVGKSSLAKILENLLCLELADKNAVKTVGLDGWHYSNDYLRSHYRNNDKSVPLISVKGSPETYDQKEFKNFILSIRSKENISFPIYIRSKHNPVMNAGTIDKNTRIILIEGNYLLLDEPIWNSLVSYYDYSIFLVAKKEDLVTRLKNRKIAGGFEEKKANDHVNLVDVPNIERVLYHSLHADDSIYWNINI